MDYVTNVQTKHVVAGHKQFNKIKKKKLPKKDLLPVTQFSVLHSVISFLNVRSHKLV